MFKDVNLDEIWYESEESKKYECGPLDDETIIKTEEQLGFKLPESYIYLMKKHNGGLLSKNYLAIKNTDGFNDLDGIYGIGDNNYSINQQNKDKYDHEENLVSICDSNSGHILIYLDYSECGPQGEPRVIAIDNECNLVDPDYKPWVLAENFEDFISRLCYEDDEKEIKKHDTIKRFKADDKIHKAVKNTVLHYHLGVYIATVIITILIFIGFFYHILLLKLLIPIDLFLIAGGLIFAKDILDRKYMCWYDVIESITTENGITKYKLKETDRKMDFIVRKKEKLEVGDKLLCISEGYAFKYKEA